jgi:hypothetical protein
VSVSMSGAPAVVSGLFRRLISQQYQPPKSATARTSMPTPAPMPAIAPVDRPPTSPSPLPDRADAVALGVLVPETMVPVVPITTEEDGGRVVTKTIVVTLSVLMTTIVGLVLVDSSVVSEEGDDGDGSDDVDGGDGVADNGVVLGGAELVLGALVFVAGSSEVDEGRGELVVISVSENSAEAASGSRDTAPLTILEQIATISSVWRIEKNFSESCSELERVSALTYLLVSI